MAIKTDIQAQINTINDGGLNTATEVRDVLGTNPSSLLENVYGSEILETQATVGGILTSNINFDYSVKIIKQGRRVFIDGSFTPNNNNVFDVFEIIANEYIPNGSFEGICYNSVNEFISCIIEENPFTNNYELKTNAALNILETFKFNINYNTLN
jgi:hypothetical protein